MSNFIISVIYQSFDLLVANIPTIQILIDYSYFIFLKMSQMNLHLNFLRKIHFLFFVILLISNTKKHLQT